MSEEDKDDRTEQPTGGRLGKAYKEGQVALSKDVVGLAGLAAASVTLYAVALPLRDSIIMLFTTAFERMATGRPIEIGGAMLKPTLLTVLVLVAASAGSIIATMAQTKGGFWSDNFMPNLGRVFSGPKLMQMFSKRQAVDLLIGLVKSVAVLWVLWTVVRAEILTLPSMLHLDADGLLTAMFGPLGAGLAKVLATMTLIAGADFALTRYRYIDQLKMTKQEVKREAKEDDGDPQIKNRRRRKHRELIKGRAAFEVPRADVVVVNPTHIAIVLRYRTDKDPAPRVTCKGKGDLAEHIRELARQNGIPIVENIPLARLLYRKVKIGRTVPAETFKAVAAILAFVYRTLGRNTSSEASL